MSRNRNLLVAGSLLLLLACKSGSHRTQTSPASPATTSASLSPSQAAPQELVTPTRLMSLAFSAYNASLALDGDVVYLFTPSAFYRMAPGSPPQKTALDLGVGPVLTDSGIVFWSKGAIWNTSREGGAVRRLAKLPHQPEYFVASSAGLAWLDGADGVFSIQSINGHKPRVLVSTRDQLSALRMIHEWVFFVQRAKDSSWRIGRVHMAGSEPEYTESRSGPTPAMLTGTESVFYYDMDHSEVRQLSPDLKSEHVWCKDFVCSPICEAKNIYCARVEGLFEILADNYQPKILYGRHETITHLRANARQVVWLADVGPDQLAVEMLPVR